MSSKDRSLIPTLLLATVMFLLKLPAVLFTLAIIVRHVRRRRRQARWEAYIRNECALYLEEVLGVA